MRHTKNVSTMLSAKISCKKQNQQMHFVLSKCWTGRILLFVVKCIVVVNWQSLFTKTWKAFSSIQSKPLPWSNSIWWSKSNRIWEQIRQSRRMNTKIELDLIPVQSTKIITWILRLLQCKWYCCIESTDISTPKSPANSLQSLCYRLIFQFFANDEK